MATGAGRFAAEIDAEFEREVSDKLTLVTRKIALEGLKRVVEKSPVDTGRFRGNWSVSIGTEDFSISDDVDPDGGPTIAAGNAVLATLQQPQVVYVQNNLPYAERLEDGWSQQAPQGVLALTVAELETIFARVE